MYVKKKINLFDKFIKYDNSAAASHLSDWHDVTFLRGIQSWTGFIRGLRQNYDQSCDQKKIPFFSSMKLVSGIMFILPHFCICNSNSVLMIPEQSNLHNICVIYANGMFHGVLELCST